MKKEREPTTMSLAGTTAFPLVLDDSAAPGVSNERWGRSLNQNPASVALVPASGALVPASETAYAASAPDTFVFGRAASATRSVAGNLDSTAQQDYRETASLVIAPLRVALGILAGAPPEPPVARKTALECCSHWLAQAAMQAPLPREVAIVPERARAAPSPLHVLFPLPPLAHP